MPRVLTRSMTPFAHDSRTPDRAIDHRKRRRNRTTQSCLNCHTSKRKCDRGRPCSRCVQLGLTGLCVYEVDDISSRDNPHIDEKTRLKNRVAELEKLVRELRGKPHPKWSTRDDTDTMWHGRARATRSRVLLLSQAMDEKEPESESQPTFVTSEGLYHIAEPDFASIPSPASGSPLTPLSEARVSSTPVVEQYRPSPSASPLPCPCLSSRDHNATFALAHALEVCLAEHRQRYPAMNGQECILSQSMSKMKDDLQEGLVSNHGDAEGYESAATYSYSPQDAATSGPIVYSTHESASTTASYMHDASAYDYSSSSSSYSPYSLSSSSSPIDWNAHPTFVTIPGSSAGAESITHAYYVSGV